MLVGYFTRRSFRGELFLSGRPMLFAKLFNFETFSVAGMLCRLVLGFVFPTLLVVSATASTSYARCGLMSADQFIVKVERLTKLDTNDLVLLPTQHFVYENGVLRTSFSHTPEPCKGPMCRESQLPSQNSPATTVSSNGSGSVSGVISRCFVFDDAVTCIGRILFCDLECESDRDRPALHPPSI